MQRPPFTLEQMRTFLAVAEQEHMTRAAESLGLTQGAVTQQVRLLERALGVQLVERIGRNIRLSDAGRTVAVACRVATRGIEGVAEAARLAAAGVAGSVHLGASATAASHYVDGPLGAFVVERPQVQLQVTVGSSRRICEEVSLGILDCGVVEDPLPPNSLSRARVAQDEVVAVARPDHPLAAQQKLTAHELAKHRHLAREEGSALDAVARVMLGQSYELANRLELGALDAVRSGAMAGLGFALLPRISVTEELRSRALVLLDFPAHRRAIHAIRRRAAASPTVEAFWEVLTRRA